MGELELKTKTGKLNKETNNPYKTNKKRTTQKNPKPKPETNIEVLHNTLHQVQKGKIISTEQWKRMPQHTTCVTHSISEHLRSTKCHILWIDNYPEPPGTLFISSP